MPQTGTPYVTQQLAALRRHSRQGLKFAELGGEGNDQPFEVAFSNLAHSFLRDKAPTLLDYEVGFQLLDKNQENTKAIGVFGFKVGSNWLCVPVFFLNGDLKGHELLYLKNQDLFVPLKENWLNYILNRKPAILGSNVDRSQSRNGIMQPNLGRLTTSPSKVASAEFKKVMGEVLPVFAACATLDVGQTMAEVGTHMDLGKFLKQAGLNLLQKLVATCIECPALAANLEEFHGLGVVDEAIKAATHRQKTASSILAGPRKSAAATCTGSLLAIPNPLKTGALQVITREANAAAVKFLEDDDLERLRRDNVLIKDAREEDEVSVTYKEQVTQTLFNPTESGLYEVLVKPATFERCFILHSPMGASHRLNVCTVVRLGDTPDWVNAAPQSIWVGERLEDKELEDWVDGLPTAETLSTGMSRYILIEPRGRNGIAPFRVTREYGNTDFGNAYEVQLDDHQNHGPSRTGSQGLEEDPMQYSQWRDGCRIHLNAKRGSKLRAAMGELFVPEGFKLLKIERSRYDEPGDDGDAPMSFCGGRDGSEKPPLTPGNSTDLSLHLLQKQAGLDWQLATPDDAQLWVNLKTAALTIYNDGSELEINRRRMPLRDGLISLVADHGLREEAARDLIKRAALRRKFVCRIKYAGPYLTESAPSAPSFPEPNMASQGMMGDQVPTQVGGDQQVPVDGMTAATTDPQVYNPNTTLDRHEVSQIQNAAQTGQREIFDTAMIGSMLKAVRDDSMVDRYLGDLTKGMDRLGRILFFFFWHGDQFAERYGKQDLPELEDSLRNSFEALGDVIIFLRQKSIQPFPEEAGSDTDLSAVANS